MRITSWVLYVNSTGQDMEFNTLFGLFEYVNSNPKKFDAGVCITIITDEPATDNQLMHLLEVEKMTIMGGMN